MDQAPEDPILRELERVDQEALENLRARMAQLETQALEEAHRSFGRYERQFEDILRRMKEAKDAFENSADELRGKLVEGPIDEDELRARMVILDMEYGGRMRLAEEGFRLLRASFEDHLDGERARARGFADDAREALRERVHLGRSKILEVFAKRDQLIGESRGELARLRAELDKARRQAGDVRFKAEYPAAERVRLEEIIQERDDQLAAARGRMQQLEAKLEALAEQARGAAESGETIQKLRAALAKARVGEPAAEQADAALRERLGEALAARAEAESAAKKLRRLLHAAEKALGDRDAEIRALRREQEDLKKRADAPPAAKPGPIGESVEHARMRELGAKVERLRQENEELEKGGAGADKLRAEIVALKRRLAETIGAGVSGLAELQAENERLKAEAARGGASASELVQARARIRELEEQSASAAAAPQADAAQTEALRRRIRELEARGAQGTPETAPLEQELAQTRRKLHAAEDARDMAQAKAEEAEEALAAQRQRLKEMQKTLLAADVTRDKRFEEEREKMALEREEIEENMLQAQRELKMLKDLHAQSERGWEQALAQQDAKRMQEIFKLRAEIQQLKWKDGGGEKAA